MKENEFHERLINGVECELSYIQQYEDNVEKGIAGIRSTDDEAAMMIPRANNNMFVRMGGKPNEDTGHRPE